MQKDCGMSKVFLLKLLFFFILINPCDAATHPKNLQFPSDHGMHIDSNLEGWSFFGHLIDANNHSFGFSLTFMRQSVLPQQSPSLWTTQDIFTSYFSITDSEMEQFYYQEKVNRTSFNFAGASASQLLIWNRGWQAIKDTKTIVLQAETKDAALTLRLLPVKSPLLLGQNGYFKTDDLYYYTLPIIQGEGELRVGEKKYQIINVKGGVEHTFQGKNNSATVWDKFVIQLNNGDDILVYILASKNSTFIYPESFCMINHPDGTSELLKLADFQLTQLNSWYSPDSKTTYPSGWTLTIPAYHYHLDIKPTMKNQEIVTPNTTYWGGQSLVVGDRDGVPVNGYAYVELSKQMSRSYNL